MNLVNLILKNEIVLFANAFKCPVEDRKEDCALAELADKPAFEIHKAVQNLSSEEVQALTRACENCQNQCSTKSSAKLYTVEIN